MIEQLESGTIAVVTDTPLGGELAVDALIGSTTLTLVDAEDLNEDGGQLSIGGETIAYVATDLDTDVVTLATPTTLAHTVEDELTVLPPSVEREAQVVLDTDGESVTARVPHALWDRIGEGIRDADTAERVTLALDSGVWYLQDVLGQAPVIDGEFIDETTLPPPVTSDGNPPTQAPILVFIGGIGSIFFRWDEITNADPVTYRLHVNAGSAPALDGSMQVASGLGLTSAAVRKLRDGTAIVSDGSVTYYGIVTVEDADGSGPSSNTASGVPAQINTPDIAVGALTAGLLTANDALIDALQVTDFSAITMTGPLFRTAAPPARRIEISDHVDGPLRLYSNLAGETKPAGLLWDNDWRGIAGVTLRARNDSARLTVREGSVTLSQDPAVSIAPGLDVEGSIEANMPYMRAFMTESGNSVAHNVAKPLNLTGAAWQFEADELVYDGTGGVPSLRIPKPGWYMCSIRIQWPSNTAGNRQVRIYRYTRTNFSLNVWDWLLEEVDSRAPHSGGMSTSLSAIVRTTQFDERLQFAALQTSGVTLTLDGGQGSLPGQPPQMTGTHVVVRKIP